MSSLYISMKTPSYELDKSPMDRAITTLAARIAAEKREGRLPEGPALDLTFLLSTRLDKPPFKGMRMGGYSPASGTLFFEAAVPESMGHSEHATRYVAAVLQDVLDNAADFFGDLDVAFDAERWQVALAPLLAMTSEPGTVH